MMIRCLDEYWGRVERLLATHPSCVVTTHVRPDGDAIGSSLALARLLRQLGCETTIITQDPVARVQQFMDPDGDVQVYEAARHDPVLRRAEVVFVLDVSGWGRVGTPGEIMQTLAAATVCIDHHQNTESFADIDITIPEAAATGALIIRLLDHLGGQMTKEIAEPLYVAIATDCGWFRFPNTTPEVLQDCTVLADTGLDISQLYGQLYEGYRWQHGLLMQRALASLQSDADGRIAWFVLKAEDFDETGGDDQDTEGFIDLVRTIKDVCLILFFRTNGDGKTKVSLRSKCSVDVSRLAQQFGGGGHRQASGISTDVPLDEFVPILVDAAKAALEAPRG